MKTKPSRAFKADPETGLVLTPRADVVFERGPVRMRIITNDLGLRASSPGENAAGAVLAFGGCSWTMGVGVENEAAFPALVGRETGLPAANLGVGSFGLVQIGRHLARLTERLHPRIVVVAYGHWMVNRCFKRNAMGDVLDRPVYVLDRRTGRLRLLEVAYCPPPGLLARIVRDRRQPPTDLAARLRLGMIGFWVKWRSGRLTQKITRRLGLNRWRYVSLDGREDDQARGWRAEALAAWLADLSALAVKNDLRVLIHHLYEYHWIDPELRGAEPGAAVERNMIDADGRVIRQWLAGRPEVDGRICYEGPEEERRHYDDYLAEQGLESGHYKRPFTFVEDHHPNATAHQMIARSIIGQLERLGWIEPGRREE